MAPASLKAVETGPIESSDDYLMGLAAGGDERAFVQLINRHEAPVRAFCSSLIGNVATGDELAQDTFLDVWNARARYRPEGRFKEYVYTAARNRCRSHARLRWFKKLVNWDSVPERAAPSVGAADETRIALERDALVRRALMQLPENFREPLTLRFVDELDYAAIARIIGRTESAARSRVHYGLIALRELLPPEVVDGLR